MKDADRLHRILDGDAAEGGRPGPGTPEAERLKAYEEALDLLATAAEPAPPDLLRGVLGALPEAPDPSWAQRLGALWPRGGRWAAPALAGAAAGLAVAVGVGQWLPREGQGVTFEVHAPGAHRVELVGSFNDWRPGELVLRGPDATGHWTTTVRLPAGRHEYMFLLDGQDLVTDPRAPARRPDGFGRENALIEL